MKNQTTVTPTLHFLPVIPVEYYIFGSIFGGLLNPSRRDAGRFQIFLWSDTDSSPGNFGVFVVREGSLKDGTNLWHERRADRLTVCQSTISPNNMLRLQETEVASRRKDGIVIFIQH